MSPTRQRGGTRGGAWYIRPRGLGRMRGASSHNNIFEQHLVAKSVTATIALTQERDSREQFVAHPPTPHFGWGVTRPRGKSSVKTSVIRGMALV